MKHVRYLSGVGAVLALAACGAHAQVGDATRGRALYENHCQVCHTGKVHVRPNRIVLSRRDVTEIVEHWQAQQKLQWGAQEVQDVVDYLARNVYKFQ